MMRARIVVLVHAVSEAHELTLAFFYLLDEGRDMVGRADLGEHAQDFLVGPAVKRAGERRDGGRRSDERVGVRTAHGPHRVGAAILLVVGVQMKRTSSARESTGFAAYFGSVRFQSMFM